MVCSPQEPWAQLPEVIAEQGFRDVAELCVATSLGFAAPFGLVALVVLRFRRGRWRTDLLLAVLVYLLVFGVNVWRCQRASAVPAIDRTLRITAREGHWWFEHPERQGAVRDEGWVAVDQRVQLLFVNETSAPVGGFLPSMRVLREVPPGRAQVSWCVPTVAGDVHLFAATVDGAEQAAPDRPTPAVLHVVDAAELARVMAEGR